MKGFVWVWVVSESFMDMAGNDRTRMVGLFPEREASSALRFVEEHGTMDYSVSAELYKAEWLKMFEKRADGMFVRLRSNYVG